MGNSPDAPKGASPKTNTLGNTYAVISVFGTIIGLIVDTIELPAKIFGDQPTENRTSIFVFNLIPPYILLIWSLVLIATLGFLRNHWENYRLKEGLSENFTNFIVVDLFNLRKYPLLILFLFIIVFFVKSIIETASFFGGVILGVMTSVLGFFLIATLFVAILMRRETVKTKVSADKDWQKWEKAISQLLKEKWIVTNYDLKNVCELLDVDFTNIDYVFLKYESQNSDKVVYGYLYNRKTGNPVVYKRSEQDNAKIPMRTIVLKDQISHDVYELR